MRALTKDLRQSPLGGLDGRFVSARTAEDVRDSHREQPPDYGAHDVDPSSPEVPGHEVRGQRPGGVHRRPADRGGPKPSEDDVPPDGERRERSDVLRLGGRAEDGAHQANRQDDLDRQCLEVRDPGTRGGGPESTDVPEQPRQEEASEERADQLSDDVARNLAPGEILPRGERDRDGGIEVGARRRAHEQDDGHDHEARGGDLFGQAQLPAAHGVDDRPSGGDQNQEEGPERLGEQAPSLERRVSELPLDGLQRPVPERPPDELYPGTMVTRAHVPPERDILRVISGPTRRSDFAAGRWAGVKYVSRSSLPRWDRANPRRPCPGDRTSPPISRGR